MKRTTAVMTAVTFLVVGACGNEAGSDLVGPTPHASLDAVTVDSKAVTVDIKGVTLPPAAFPFPRRW